MLFDNKDTLPETCVYVGHGASHSWTWFADILERAGYYSVCFLNEKDIQAGALSACDVLCVSGGDTFGIADGLGLSGAEQIGKFVSSGGTYIGSCAGAYLPLRSSLAPLNLFNFVNVRIANLSKNLPAPQQMADKFCTEYGCRYVFHPVREEVAVTLEGRQEKIKVPLYGGPAMLPSDEADVLAVYDSFTDKTEFLIDAETARETLIGKVSACSKRFDKGIFYLFGPHFEHPHYPEANELLFRILSESRRAAQKDESKETFLDVTTKDAYRKFLSEISNARIISLALERNAYQWTIGKKIYDPEKIRVFLEAIWGRARLIESKGWYAYIAEHEIDAMLQFAVEIICLLKRLRETAAPAVSDAAAGTLFPCLRDLAARFLSIYFKLRRYNLLEHEGRVTCTTATCISRQQQHCTQCR